VNGSSFVSGSTIRWNGSSLSTTFVNSTRLTVTIPTADLAEEGKAVVTVFNPPSGGGTSNAVNFTVDDASIVATGTPVTATMGRSFTAQVATFTDANAAALSSDFTISIAWGDGLTSAGTASSNGNGGFAVMGTHTYAAAGTYSVSITIMDDGGARASATTMAHVAGKGAISKHSVTLIPQDWELPTPFDWRKHASKSHDAG
jgi:hypothetical protein